MLDTSSGRNGESSDKVLFIGPDSEAFAKKIQHLMKIDEDMNSSSFGKKGCCPTCGMTEGKIARDDPTKMSPEQLMEAYMKLSTTLFGTLERSL